MYKSYKYRIYPSKEQIILIEKTFGCCRFVYNYFLDLKSKTYTNSKEDLSIYECCHILCEMKKMPEYDWLKEPDKWALGNSLRDLERAYKMFFKKVNKFPRFKSKKNRKQSYRTTQGNNNTSIEVFTDAIKLPKLGLVKYKQSNCCVGIIKNATIFKKPSGKYFVSILYEEDDNTYILPKCNNAIGIDLGIKNYIITSKGDVIGNPKLYRKLEKKLKREQRKLDGRIHGSSNYNKQRIKLARLHEKIVNQRRDFQHKLSTQIVNENQIIICEDLNIEGMLKNHKLAKSIFDAAWSGFLIMLEYKSKWKGRIFHKIGRFEPSSKLCSNCGYKYSDLDLSVREWTCPDCGVWHDRDVNAAKNILAIGLRDLNLT